MVVPLPVMMTKMAQTTIAPSHALPFLKTGTIGYTGTVGPEWLFVNMLFSIIPMMAALPLLNRYFFNKTGRAWLGAIVVCAIFVIMTGSGTTIYYAL